MEVRKGKWWEGVNACERVKGWVDVGVKEVVGKVAMVMVMVMVVVMMVMVEIILSVVSL